MTIDAWSLAAMLLAAVAAGAFIGVGAVIRAGLAMLKAQRKAGTP